MNSNFTNMVNGVMRKPIKIAESDFDSVQRHSDTAQNTGFVVDSCIKRAFAPHATGTSERYASFDVDLGDMFVEVKCSNKWVDHKWNVPLSFPERAHAELQLTRGIDTAIMFFDAREAEHSVHDLKTIKFVGLAMFSEISDFLERKQGKSKPYWQFSQSFLYKELYAVET